MSLLNDNVIDLINKSKGKYYKNVVEDIKNSNEKQCYSKLKRISSYDIHLHEPLQVAELCKYSKEEQAELFTDKFSNKIPDYDAFKQCDIQVPPFSKESIQHITHIKVNVT